MIPALSRTGLGLFLATALGGCIDSSRPILTDAKPEFGSTLRLEVFGLHGGSAHDPEQVTYVWTGTHYAHAGGGMKDVAGFSVFPFEQGAFIAQSVPRESNGATEYALLYKLTDGVFQVLPIDEDDADVATRTAHCHTTPKWSCRIETNEQLVSLSRATAARRKSTGGLAVILAPER